ncbi:HEAT repeat domain-containing protein [Peribacillus sp. B-H-3]|uniref:HEAT repeat domain-containing protein n=1 Tax=Peribacillus sp. B-H-3 TaxID=3400420 RepID=UPI003B01DA6D
MVEKELLDLIKEMSGSDTIYNESEGYYTSEGSPSWIAFRRAEQLTDVDNISFLNNLLENSKDRKTRENVYFILGKIGTNTGDRRVADILLKRLEKETNKYSIEEILSRIAEQRNVKDCSPIIKFISDERSSVRHSAIEALRGCKSSKAEEALIEIISESIDEYDLNYANSVLSEIGTNKAIPHLINLLEHPKGSVKCSALWALKELGSTSLLPIFLKALQNRPFDVKGYAMLAINKHGNESAINPVIERIKNMLKRKRTVESDDLLVALEFLIRFKDDYKEISDLFDWIKSKKWVLLFGIEKNWLHTKFKSLN